jgi:hypothetical protein
MRKCLVVLFLSVSNVALADRIDGFWCSVAGRIEVEGPKLTLPDGTAIEGRYSRHEFFYTVPEGREGAGNQVDMRLRSEQDMTSFTLNDQPPTEPIDWKRCQATS